MTDERCARRGPGRCASYGSGEGKCLAILLASVFLVAAAVSNQAIAAPALGEPTLYEQPDGTQFWARNGGDEWKNWTSTEGVLIVHGADGFWYYAKLAGGMATPSGARVGIDAVPAGVATTADVPALSVSKAKALEEEMEAPAPAPSLSGPQPTLVLLVQFADRSLGTTVADWAQAFFGTSGKTLRTYYDEVSCGAFYFGAAAESQGTVNDGIVTITLGYNHPNTGGSTGDPNRQVVRDALIAADSYVNFAAFNTDMNAGLSTSELHVVTVLAGYEAAYSGNTPSVWAHRWSLWGTVAAPQLDGVYVSSASYGGGYTQQGEYHSTHMATIGILAHELGHDIGLPDLYDTDGGSEGIGAHGLMGSGNWGAASGEYSGASPTHMCAWSKETLGIVSPTVVSSDGPYALPQTSSGAYLPIRINTADPNQYFLVENRQLTGFDAGLWRWFGGSLGGLAVWHIDESRAGNQDETHKLVDLEEANEGILGYSELDNQITRGNRQHYYYQGHVTHFGDGTTPNSRLYTGASTGIDISSVSASGSSMTCWISIGVPPRGFEVKSSLGTVLMVDQVGNLLLKGSVTQNSTPTATAGSQILVKGSGGTVVATADSSGNLVLAGSLYTQQTTLTPPQRSLVFKNLAGNVVGYISLSGEMRVKGMVFPLP